MNVIVIGGGAAGLFAAGWAAKSGLRVLVLETAHPAAIRRQVSLCEAVYEGETAVEGMRGIRVETLADADAVWAQNAVPILIDPTGACLPQARPAVLVDAIIAKKNLGTTREMAPLTIALGPGFAAGQDVDVVVETKRGHKLGRIIREGSAAPNSGVPGIIGGLLLLPACNAPLPIFSDSLVSVARFSPGHFRRRTSRPVSYYALFEWMAASEPTSWLSSKSHILFHLTRTWGP